MTFATEYVISDMEYARGWMWVKDVLFLAEAGSYLERERGSGGRKGPSGRGEKQKMLKMNERTHYVL